MTIYTLKVENHLVLIWLQSTLQWYQALINGERYFCMDDYGKLVEVPEISSEN